MPDQPHAVAAARGDRLLPSADPALDADTPPSRTLSAADESIEKWMDRGRYFRGLLALVRQDRHVTAAEREVVMRVGRRFGFARDFCREALDEVLSNPHLREQAPSFSDPLVARLFLVEAMALSQSDGRLDPRELRWLQAAAARNGIEWQVPDVPGGQAQTQARLQPGA
jgi:hypothetical protein